MKKIITIIVLIITICLLTTACNNKKTKKIGGWEVDLTNQQLRIDKNALAAFKRATKKSKEKYKVIALLGKQVVSGTNYMFLCKSNTYKIVVVYNDLKNNSTLKSSETFDFTKYVNKDISYDDTNMTGNWYVDIPNNGGTLPKKINSYFKEATKDITDIKYTPITVLGHQLVSGTNYAIICYGKTTSGTTGIYILTIYENLHQEISLTSSSYVFLAEYNK